ncbi:alpha/beta fold hydrolase [Phenylobacterium sp.]|uniref:alpha/beta fold hydrolase n=1 Tax=Phenylobacterium sp. TaxID=1871053 RepID=UPI00301C1347
MRVLLRVLIFAVLAAVAAWGAVAVAAEAASRTARPRGEMIDIGGRKLRLVCEGPRSDRPVVWLEAGAFSGAADFAALQQILAARGLRSCAYDRAGMGWSDRGPSPRDGDAIAADLEALVKASGERGPFVLVGHSMAGLYMRQFAVRNPDQVVGLVLVDAVTPDMMAIPDAQKFIDAATSLSGLGAAAGTLWLTKPLYWMPDRIGLPGFGLAEKRRGFVSGRQARTAYAEVKQWRAAAAQAKAAGDLDPEWPVAVVTAGSRSGRMAEWNAIRNAPATAARHGMVDNVDEATHTSVLGRTWGERVARGVDFVIAAARP